MNKATVGLSIEALISENRIKWLTSKEAAFLLRTSEGQIRNWVWNGRLKAHRLGNRLRFLRSDVEALLKPAF